MTLEHSEVRDKLVAAALELMAEGGIEAVKARTLAGKVGVSVGSVYNLFGNVDGVIEQACGSLFERLAALGEARKAEIGKEFSEKLARGEVSDSPSQRLRHALLALSGLYIDFVTDNENSWAGLLAFNRARPVGDAADWYLDRQSSLIGLLGDLLDGAPGMEDDNKRQATAWALWSAVHGIVTLSYVGQVRPETLARTNYQIETLVTLLVNGIFATAG